MTVKIQLRRGTAAQWTSTNPTLLSGEQGLETDTGKTKIGDGVTAWNSLGYAFVPNSLVTAAGQVVASTGSGAPAVVTAGTTDGHILTWDSAVSTKMKWAAAPASGIPATLLDAKGDLIVASAADTAARLAVGTNGQALLADSTTATGLRWGAVGKVLQVVSTFKDDTFTATGTTYTDITGLSATITPTATTSKILVLVNMYGTGTANSSNVGFQIVRGSTAIGNGATAGVRVSSHGMGYEVAGGAVTNMTGMYLDSPATSSSTTYKIQARNNSGSGNTFYINRAQDDTDGTAYQRFASSITLLEIAA